VTSKGPGRSPAGAVREPSQSQHRGGQRCCREATKPAPRRDPAQGESCRAPAAARRAAGWQRGPQRPSSAGHAAQRRPRRSGQERGGCLAARGRRAPVEAARAAATESHGHKRIRCVEGSTEITCTVLLIVLAAFSSFPALLHMLNGNFTTKMDAAFSWKLHWKRTPTHQGFI